MIEAPSVAQAAATLVAMIHLRIPRSEIQSVMGPAISEIYAAIKDQGVTPAGPWFTHHRTITPEEFDFEVCVPVTSPVEPTGRVTPGEFPAATVVRTVHHGRYDGPDGLAASWGEFGNWISANGHSTRTDLFECYLVGPDSNPDPQQWRTELSRVLA